MSQVVNVYERYIRDALHQLRIYRDFIFERYSSAKTPEEAEFFGKYLRDVDETIKKLEDLLKNMNGSDNSYSETKTISMKELIGKAIVRATSHHFVQVKNILAANVLKYSDCITVEIYLKGSPIYVGVDFDKDGKIKNSYIGWINSKEA